MDHNNINKYFISIKTIHLSQCLGSFHMMSSNKTNIEMLRMELFKEIKYIEHTDGYGIGNLCGWIFYENIYEVISIKQFDEEFYK